MYNRYIPDGAVYTRVTMDDDEPAVPENRSAKRDRSTGSIRGLRGAPAPAPPPVLPEGVSSSLKSLVSSLGLEKLDSGDLLLFLILLLLLKEGDDLEMIIALGLTLLMGLGEGEEK